VLEALGAKLKMFLGAFRIKGTMCEDLTLFEVLSVHPPAYLAYRLFAMFFTIMSNYAKMLGQNYFVKLACCDSSSSNFNLQAHILNTGGAALTPRSSA